MEKNTISPGGMAVADLFGPLTTPISALDFKDKVKITIKRNAGIRCLKVPKPCEILTMSSAGGRGGGGRIGPKVSLPRPTTGLEGDRPEPKPYLKMSPFIMSGGRENPKPCEILAMSSARGRGGGRIRPKVSLPGPTTGLEGARPEPKPYLSPFIMSGGRENPKPGTMMVKAVQWKGRKSATIQDASAHIKDEPALCESAGGAHSVQTHNEDESLTSTGAGGTETDPTQMNYICKTEECVQSATDDLSDTQYISVHIKEEPLTDEEQLSDHMTPNMKTEPDNLTHNSLHIKEEPLSDHMTPNMKTEPDNLTHNSLHIKEEPLSDHMTPTMMTEPDNLTHNSLHIKEEPLSEDQIITIKIKEEPTSSQEESDEEEEGVHINHIREESGGPSTSSKETHKIWPSAPQKDRILQRTSPLVIRNPHITERKMAPPRKIKTGLLKKLIELDTPSSDNAHKMRTLTCTPVKMYKCSKCGRYFTSRLRLRRHCLAHRKYKVACPDCGRLFACKATVLRHQVVHSEDKPFPCSFCEKSFSTDKGREIHQRRHAGDKPFGCAECGKNFLFRSQLKSHQMIHTGERYSCHECGRCYRTKPGLVLHMRIHSGDFPYWCPECGKGFVQKSSLKNHLHTHSEEKPFTCLECGRGFRQKYNLKQHMNVHAAKECEKYSCPECGKSYKRKADYRWHLLIHLGEK